MATYLLKKSYQRKDLKKVSFKDLWDSHGVFTTMWIFDKPVKILFFKEHFKNLIKSLKTYKLNKPNIEKDIFKLIKINLNKHKKYNHLLRVAVTSNLISISLRKKPKLKSKLILKLINYKRTRPEFKNLKYKKILSYLSKIETSSCDLGLCVNGKVLESATSNILFVNKGKVYSPINKFYRGTTLKFFEKKMSKIIKKNIYIKSLHNYEEIILIGSGKGVVSVSNIKELGWIRKSSTTYRFLSKIYNKTVTNCPRYNG
jgi:4-amino-4-deoxychorismate lyase